MLYPEQPFDLSTELNAAQPVLPGEASIAPNQAIIPEESTPLLRRVGDTLLAAAAVTIAIPVAAYVLAEASPQTRGRLTKSQADALRANATKKAAREEMTVDELTDTLKAIAEQQDLKEGDPPIDESTQQD